mmetsp:Transcript_9922/g.20202  ORF Transcript_9922/g.20202 Transcript_9922/m.20202 type:complete len:298 (-) Transcript_9922:21-914(-)
MITLSLPTLLLFLLLLFVAVLVPTTSTTATWSDIKVKEGVIRDVIYPKASSTTTKTSSNTVDYEKEYIYGPTVLMPFSSSCFDASTIPDDMTKSGNGRASKDVWKNVTVCPFFNVTTSRGQSGKSKKTFEFKGYERNVVSDFGGAPEIKGLVAVYGGKKGEAAVDVRISYECIEREEIWGEFEVKDDGGQGEKDDGEDNSKATTGGSSKVEASVGIEFSILGEKDGVLHGSLSVPFGCNMMDSPIGWEEEGKEEVRRRAKERERIITLEQEEKERKEKGKKEKKNRKGSCPKCECPK